MAICRFILALKKNRRGKRKRKKKKNTPDLAFWRAISFWLFRTPYSNIKEKSFQYTSRELLIY